MLTVSNDPLNNVTEANPSGKEKLVKELLGKRFDKHAKGAEGGAMCDYCICDPCAWTCDNHCAGTCSACSVCSTSCGFA